MAHVRAKGAARCLESNVQATPHWNLSQHGMHSHRLLCKVARRSSCRPRMNWGHPTPTDFSFSVTPRNFHCSRIEVTIFLLKTSELVLSLPASRVLLARLSLKPSSSSFRYTARDCSLAAKAFPHISMRAPPARRCLRSGEHFREMAPKKSCFFLQ